MSQSTKEKSPTDWRVAPPRCTKWMEQYAVSSPRKGAILATIPQLAPPAQRTHFVGHRPLSARHQRLRSTPNEHSPEQPRRPETAKTRKYNTHSDTAQKKALPQSEPCMYSREAVESLVHRLTKNFSELLQAQRGASDRLVHKVIDEYEARLKECSCARTVRRQMIAERSHEAMDNALRSFQESEVLVSQAIALTDAGIQKLLEELAPANQQQPKDAPDTAAADSHAATV